MTPGGAAGRARPSELRLRIASSLVLGAVALAAAWAGGWPWAALWLLAGGAVAFEWLTVAAVAPERASFAVLALGLAAAQLAVLAGSWPVVAGSLAIAALAAMAIGRTGRDRAWSLAGLAVAAAVSLVPVALRAEPAFGMAAVAWIFAVVWTTDIAAYFTGRGLGGPKLWPAVSPKKTWSGFAGGLAGGTVAGLSVALVAARHGAALPGEAAAIGFASALASIVSQGGDLAESAMKRRFGVKDSGSLIPGHGGVMDRLDGFAAVAILVGLAMAGSAALAPSGRP